MQGPSLDGQIDDHEPEHNMPLDPQAEAFLKTFYELNIPPFEEVSIEEARSLSLPLPGEPEAVSRIEDRRVPGSDPGVEIPVRIYWPKEATTDDRPRAALVFFHGGGWVIGSLETYQHFCCSLANAGDCVVVSVDYRLAPENRFPAAAEDSYVATVWVAEHAAELGIDSERIVVGGDSAGGNLAAVVSLMARDRSSVEIAYQILIYPITDFAFETASYRENGEGYFLTTGTMKWFWKQYLNDDAEGSNPYCSPLRADSLVHLPPAYVMTAEFDPLLTEGEAYAARLQEAGVPVVLEKYDGQIHGFIRRTDLYDRANEAVARIGNLIQELGERKHE